MIEAFVYETKEIELTNGGAIKVPPLSWGKELQIIKILGNTYNKVIKSNKEILSSIISDSSETYRGKGTIELDISHIIGNIMSETPDAITKICSIITGKSEKYITDKLVLEDVMEICLPFLGVLLKKMTKLMETNLSNIIQVVEEVKEV